MVVIFSVKNLRRHIVFRSFFGEIRRRLVADPRDTKIADLKIAVIIDKNIVRLDIPVNDAFALKELQRLHQLPAHPQDIRLRNRMLLYISLNRHQKLHPDQNIPLNLILIPDYLIIFAVYDMREALHIRHDLDLICQIIDHILKKSRDGPLIHPIPVKGSLQ